MRACQVSDDGLSADTAPLAMAGAHGLDPAAVIVGCLMFALVMFLPAILNDGDTFWQICTGAWILDHRAIPAIDPFSFTAGDRPWVTHEWLAEILMALAFRAAGLPGVMVLTAGAVGLTAGVLLHYLRRFLPGVYALLALAVALSNTAPSMLARPHLLAWPCLALWCGSLVTARANRRAPSFALLPVMVLWINLHGSFMVGLMLSGAFMIEALFDSRADRRRVLISWGGFTLAAWVVALLNPDFLAGVLFPIKLVGMQSTTVIGEWLPTGFNGLQPLEVTILACLALGFSGRVRLPPIRLLILLGLIHGALSHARHEQLLGIVGVLIVAEPFGASLGRGCAEASRRAWRSLAAGAALVALVALAGRIALPLGPERSGAAFAALLDRVPPALRARPVLNEYGLGGQLIFDGVRPFIDGRADLYGDAFLMRYQRIVAPDRAELERALVEYGIVWTIFPANHPVVQVLDQEPGWRRLVAGDGIVIHARVDQLAQCRPPFGSGQGLCPVDAVSRTIAAGLIAAVIMPAPASLKQTCPPVARSPPGWAGAGWPASCEVSSPIRSLRRSQSFAWAAEHVGCLATQAGAAQGHSVRPGA